MNTTPKSVESLYFSDWSACSRHFDYVIVGAGAYGTSFAHKILELDSNCSVLILEKGPFLIPDHIQNLPSAFVDINKTGTTPWKNTGSCRFMPQIPFVGGRALLWNAWIPQPNDFEFINWPKESLKAINREWKEAASYMGRRYGLTSSDNKAETLSDFYHDMILGGLNRIDTALEKEFQGELLSPMATNQTAPPSLWSKFAPIAPLVTDCQKYGNRLTVVPNCEVMKLNIENERACSIETKCGVHKLGKNTKVVLAANTLEATAILLRSLPDNERIGKNLSGHIRSWLAVRMKKEHMPISLDKRFQAAAFYLNGKDEALDRYLHTHISIVYNPHPDKDREILYRSLPDASDKLTLDTYNDPDYVVFMLHSMGEILGEPSINSPNYITVNSVSGETEIHMISQEVDEQFWQSMDKATYQTADLLTKGKPVEYQLKDGSWSVERPKSIRNSGLVHESGTLWMGDKKETSVSNHWGAIHDASNVYGTGSMVFPRPGSWNPTFTGVAMAFALARELAPVRELNK